LRPVPTGFTTRLHGNILNEPQTIEAYRKKLTVYFADGLKGPLPILHGMVFERCSGSGG
jgi:hypothetical protein